MSTGAFFNDAALKEKLVEGIKQHIFLDHLMQGTYGTMAGPLHQQKWLACAVGCAAETMGIIKTNQVMFVRDGFQLHERLSGALNIPVVLFWLYDAIFENCESAQEATRWTKQFIDAIPVGANLGPVVITVSNWWSNAWKRDLLDLLPSGDDDDSYAEFMETTAHSRQELKALLLRELARA